MSEKQSIVEEIYKTRIEDLPVLATKSIRYTIGLIEGYAGKIIKKGNIFKTEGF